MFYNTWLMTIFFRLIRSRKFLSTFILKNCIGSKIPAEQQLQKLLKIMPKESNLRHIRQRVLGNTPPPSEAFFQVVGDGSLGSPRVVILVTPASRYLFNCGEGTQRIIQEHKLRLSRVENVFFTTKSWRNIGGFPGLSLTVKDIGVPKLTIHGPEGLGMIYPMTKRFLQVQDLELEQRALSDLSYKDETLTVTYVPILPSSHIKSSKRDLPVASESVTKRLRRSSSSGESAHDIAVAYIGKIAPKVGMLILSECIKHGVPPGPLLSKLKEGLDVLVNGKIVRSADVCGPTCPGPVFIVVECPSENHVVSLVENDVFSKHQQFATEDHNRAEVVIHFTPQNVLKNPLYQKWMNDFSASTNHLVINESNHNPSSISIYRIQTMLNLLNDVIFPILPAQIPKILQTFDEDYERDHIIIPGRPLQKYYLRPPQKKVIENQCFELDDDAYRAEAFENNGLKEALEANKIDQPSRPFVEDFQEPDVTFLGTGSAVPSKVRNTSGILLRTTRDCSILLDCGEGTLGQLFRFFGPKLWESEIRRLKAIMISHPHADHHLGLISVLLARKALFAKTGELIEKLLLFLPEPVSPYLHTFSDEFEFIEDCFEVISCNDWFKGVIDENRKGRILSQLQLAEIKIVQVIHCPYSFGVSLTAETGWKICYSGDTMPCDSLVEAGMDSDLLIHEATMEDSMVEDAKKKMHSTTSQAIEIGKQMRAKFTMLTHFSQRYAKIPLLKEELPTDVGIAFDNMRVRLSDLPTIPKMLPALKLMFSESHELMQERSEKRERRQQWEQKTCCTTVAADKATVVNV